MEGGRPARWRRTFKDAAHTAATALSHAPESAAYGLIALAPLGASFGPTAMALALLGAVAANAVASALGLGRLVSGPRAAMALLTATLVTALLQGLPADDPATPWVVMLLAGAGVAAAGALQMLFGLLRLGVIVKFTPYPVRVGLTSGVGLLLILNVLPVALGFGFGAGWYVPWTRIDLVAAAPGLCALMATWVASRARTRVSPVLLGLAAAWALQAVVELLGGAALHAERIGSPVLPADWLTGMATAASALPGAIDRRVLALVGGYALTVAVLCALDALLAASIVDGRLRAGRDTNRELMAQGLANVAAACVGGQPASPSVPRSLALVLPQPGRRHAVLGYAAALLALLLLAPQLLGLLPIGAVGGVLLYQGAQMLSPSLWKTPAELWQQRAQPQPGGASARARWRMLAANWAVAAVVAISLLLLGLGPAVLIGATFAVLLFVRSNMRDVVRGVWTGETRRSLKMRPPALAEELRSQGSRIALLELEGSLFFGTADGLRVRLQSMADTVDTVILDLQQVTEFDVTAARILFEAAEDWDRVGRRLVFAEWPPGDPRRVLMEAVAGPAAAANLHCADHTDAALEQAEDRLLAQLQQRGHADQMLALADTMIGRGLQDHELALLSTQMQTLQFARGNVMFGVGDPGDALYISLKGEIGLRLPGSARRLASFAPGVTIGEMALLAHGTRSAEAVAESDVVALRLPVEAFDRLKVEHPALAAKLLNNLALHLADRVRTLTGDLARWVARTAAGGGVEPVLAQTADAAHAEANE